jgi:tetratricopeptide (TPR) repeat protein
VPLLADVRAEPEKVPEVEQKEPESPQGYWDWSSLDTEPAEETSETADDGETDQIASYRELGVELFREGRYQEALFEFNKVLCVYPDDEVAIDYSYRSSFELGLALFQMKDYLAAREHFLTSLRYNSECGRCHAYVKESEELYKETYYKQGIEFYGKEQLSEAIKAWEMVQQLDPDYKRVDYYIRKAREIQKKLEELKRETPKALVD